MENPLAMDIRHSTQNIFPHGSKPIRLPLFETYTAAIDLVPQITIDKLHQTLEVEVRIEHVDETYDVAILARNKRSVAQLRQHLSVLISDQGLRLVPVGGCLRQGRDSGRQRLDHTLHLAHPHTLSAGAAGGLSESAATAGATKPGG